MIVSIEMVISAVYKFAGQCFCNAWFIAHNIFEEISSVGLEKAFERFTIVVTITDSEQSYEIVLEMSD